MTEKQFSELVMFVTGTYVFIKKTKNSIKEERRLLNKWIDSYNEGR